MRSRSDPPYATVGRVGGGADLEDFEENEENQEETTTEKPVTARLQTDQDCLFHACLYGHGETVLAILADATLEIAELEPLTGQTAFHLACIRGHLSIVQYLHKKFGAKVCFNLKNREELTGLEIATELGKSDVVQAILQAVPKKQTR